MALMALQTEEVRGHCIGSKVFAFPKLIRQAVLLRTELAIEGCSKADVLAFG